MVERGRYKKVQEIIVKILSTPTQITHSTDSYFAILLKEITALNTSYLPFFNKKAQSIKIGLFNESGLYTESLQLSNSLQTVTFTRFIPKPLPQAHHYGNGTHHQAY